MTTFTVWGAPATKGSTVSFRGRDGRIVTRPDCKGLGAWSQAVAWAARAANVPLAPPYIAVAIEVVFQFVRPKSVSVLRTWPTVKPDADKLARALLDSLTGIAYVDDAQVVRIAAQKSYGVDAQTTVTVGRM